MGKGKAAEQTRLAVSPDEKKKKMKSAAEGYAAICNANSRAAMGENRDYNRAFLSEYSNVIEDYINAFGTKKKDGEEVDALLRDYFLQYPVRKPFELPPLIPSMMGSSSKALKEQQEQQKKKKEQEDREGREPAVVISGRGIKSQMKAMLRNTQLHQNEISQEDAEIENQGISADAMDGLKDISQWMLRNCLKTGPFGSDEKTHFVTEFVLKQPARVKLLGYYLLETDKRKATGKDNIRQSIVESQMGYKPDLEKFKSKMIASKGKFWLRLTGDQFYWDKLSQSMRMAVANQSLLKPFGMMSIRENAIGGGAATEARPAEEQQQQERPRQTGGQQPLGQSDSHASDPAAPQNSRELERLKLLSKQRQDCFDFFMLAGQELLAQRKKYEDNPSTNTAEVLLKLNFFEAALHNLEESDDTIGAEFEKVFNSEKGKQATSAQINQVREGKVSQARLYTGMGGKLVGAGGSVLGAPLAIGEKYNDIANAVNTGLDESFVGQLTSWRLDKIPADKMEQLKITKSVGKGITIFGAAVSVLSAIFDLIEMHDSWTYTTKGSKFVKTLEIASNLSSAASSTINGVQSIMGVSEAAMETTGAITGTVTGSINIAAGATSFINASLNRSRFTSAQEGAKKSGDKKAENIAKLGHRLATTNQMKSTVKMIAGGLQLAGGILTLTGVGAVVGAVLGGAGSAISLLSIAISFFRKKRNINETLDEYLDMDQMFAIVKSNVKSGDVKVIDSKKDKIKDQLRVQAAAHMGYPSKASLYNAITFEYATDIHNNIFFKDGIEGGEPITDKTQIKGTYRDIIAGLDLKPDYKNKKPDIEDIAKTLRNV